MKKRVSFNSPVSLIFAICCLVATLLSLYLPKGVAEKVANFFNAPNCQSSENAFNWKNALDYFRLFLYVFKHSDWNHLLSNLAFILLLGPMMELRFGKTIFSLMILTATFVAGILCASLLSKPMSGASGIVFMLILLNTLASITKSEIPVTFVLVLVAFLAKEILTAVDTKNIAIIAQIAGAVCGSLFTFLIAPKGRSPKPKKTARYEDEDSEVVGTLSL